MILQQLSVFLENRAGQLAEVTALLAAHQMNLRAIHIAETADYGVLRLIVDDPDAARALLKEQGYVLSVTPVVAVEVEDQPGGLSKLLEKMAAAQIDVEYMYSVFGTQNGRATMIFRVRETERLEQLKV